MRSACAMLRISARARGGAPAGCRVVQGSSTIARFVVWSAQAYHAAASSSYSFISQTNNAAGLQACCMLQGPHRDPLSNCQGCLRPVQCIPADCRSHACAHVNIGPSFSIPNTRQHRPSCQQVYRCKIAAQHANPTRACPRAGQDGAVVLQPQRRDRLLRRRHALFA